MNKDMLDLAELEPKIVHLTKDVDNPTISVRMPVFPRADMYDEYYMEYRYESKGGMIFANFHFSPKFTQWMNDSIIATTRLYSKRPELHAQSNMHTRPVGVLVPIMEICIGKLIEFHRSEKWKSYIIL